MIPSKSISGFDPRSIPGLSLWLDAADTSTLMLSTNNVTQWNDKSGSGNNATQTTTSNQPTTGGSQNGLNTLLFTGKMMTYPTISLSAQTVFCVYLNNTFTPYGMPVHIGPFAFFYAAPSSNVGIGRTGVTDEVLANWSTNGLTTSNYTVYGGTVSVSGSTTSVLYFNGKQVASNTVTSSGGLVNYTIGTLQSGANTVTGYIAEVIVFNSVLGTTQRQSVEGYLAWKWGLHVQVPAPVQTPLSISGCQLWLDAADTTKIAPAAGGTLTSWTDKSGTGKTVTVASAPTYSLTSFNGLPSVTFASGNSLTIPITAPGTNDIAIFAVWKQTANSVNNVFSIGVSASGSETAIGWNGGESLYKLYRYGGAESRNNNFSYNTNIVSAGVQISGTRSLYINGTAPVFSATETYNQTNTTVYIGGGGFSLIGQVAEIIYYQATLSTTQRQSIENYLMGKWGIKPSLPAIHPFYSLPPFSRPFGPLDIPGCALWLDAADLNSITFTTPPLAYFPFDGSIVDQSNVITFTTTGSVPYVTGKYGQAVSFVNAQGAVSSNYLSSTYNLPSTFTIAAWIQLPVTSGKYTIIATGPNSGYTLGSVLFYVSAGNMYCAYNHIANNGAGYPVSANTWYHAAITYNSGTLLLYVNGVQSGSPVTAGGSTINGITIGGGSDIGADPYPVTGYVDDLRIYNSVLTAAQISNIYTNTQTSNVVSWKDKSGNGNNGTSIGNAESTVWSSNGMGGYPAIAFDGATGSFSGTIASNTGSTLSMFAVAFMNLGTSVNVYPRIISLAASGSQDWNLSTSTFLGRNGGGGVTQSVVTYRNGSVISYQPITYGVPFLASSVYTGSSNTTYANGTTAGAGASSGNFSVNAYNIGRIAGGAGFNTDSTLLGSVSEVLVYGTALTDSQRQQVEGYLAAKWGLQSNLPGATFSPLTVSGCKLWLDAADTSTISATGTTVTTWANKTGNAPATTGGGTVSINQAYRNGISSVRFPAGTNYLSVGAVTFSTQYRSVFMVATLPAASTPGTSFFNSLFGDYVSGQFGAYSNTVGLGYNGYTALLANPSGFFGTTSLVSICAGSTDQGIFINGVSQTLTTNNVTGPFWATGATTTLTLGGGSTSTTTGTLDIYEIMQYDGTITTSQRQSIENYLMRKWGISNVTTHPFKSIPPSTSQPPQFQEVTPGNWKYDWQPYLQRLAAANSGATAVFSSNAVSGSEPNTNGSWSMNLAPNGLIYTFPTNSSYIGIINPTTSVYTYNAISTGYGSDGYKYIGGGALHPNGNIYVPPGGNPANVVNVGVFTPSGSSGTFTTIASTSNAATDAFDGGAVLAPNGMIYLVPLGSAYIGRIDGNGTFTSNSVSGTVPTGNKYGGAALGPNGLIYCIPCGIGRNVGVIDPVANTYSSNYVTMVNTVVDYAFFGGVLAPNGKIYCIPRNSTTVGIIDPVANTFTNGPALSSATNAAGSGVGGDAYWGGCLGPDGNIYCAPMTANNILVINPTTNTVSYLSTGFTSPLYRGIIMAPNGKLYMKSAGNGPIATRSVATISFTGLNQLPSSNWCLSPYANRSP